MSRNLGSFERYKFRGLEGFVQPTEPYDTYKGLFRPDQADILATESIRRAVSEVIPGETTQLVTEGLPSGITKHKFPDLPSTGLFFGRRLDINVLPREFVTDKSPERKYKYLGRLWSELEKKPTILDPHHATRYPRMAKRLRPVRALWMSERATVDQTTGKPVHPWLLFLELYKLHAYKLTVRPGHTELSTLPMRLALGTMVNIVVLNPDA